jgi:hypothetical protein
MTLENMKNIRLAQQQKMSRFSVCFSLVRNFVCFGRYDEKKIPIHWDYQGNHRKILSMMKTSYSWKFNFVRLRICLRASGFR